MKGVITKMLPELKHYAHEGSWPKIGDLKKLIKTYKLPTNKEKKRSRIGEGFGKFSFPSLLN